MPVAPKIPDYWENGYPVLLQSHVSNVMAFTIIYKRFYALGIFNLFMPVAPKMPDY